MADTDYSQVYMRQFAPSYADMFGGAHAADAERAYQSQNARQQGQFQQEATDWRHANISVFQQNLKAAHDSELLEQEQWGRMASQNLDAYNHKQSIAQQAGINQQRDQGAYAHETALHEMQLKGSMAMEELRLRHSDFFDEAKLRQNDEEFKADLNQKQQSLLQAHQEWQAKEEQMELAETNRAVGNGEGYIDDTELKSVQQQINSVNQQERDNKITHSVAQQRRGELYGQRQQAMVHGYTPYPPGQGPRAAMTPQKVWDQSAPMDPATGQKMPMPALSGYTQNKNGTSYKWDTKPPAGQANQELHIKEFNAKQKEKRKNYVDTKIAEAFTPDKDGKMPNEPDQMDDIRRRLEDDAKKNIPDLELPQQPSGGDTGTKAAPAGAAPPVSSPSAPGTAPAAPQQGQQDPAVDKAIAAARSGNKRAQEALQRKGISWQ